jgi:hypothetical protein
MNLEVRLANPADLDWLIDQDRHVSPDWVRRCVAADEILVASLDGALVGFLRFAWFWRAIPYMEPEPQAWHRRNGFVEAGALTFGKLEPTPEVFFVKDL